MIKGISESNKRDYANGHRDRFKQTKKARNRTRELILEGRHNWQNEEFIIKNNQNLGKRNYGKTWGEEKFGWALKQNNIEFESQYKIEKGFDSIGRKRFYFIDFAIPKLKIAIEIDGIFHFKIENVSRDADRQRYIESLGWTFLRFKDSEAREQLGDCIEKTLRLIQNHSGEYKFMDWAVKNVRHWVPKSRKTLYNLEVEEDESYIAKGFVVHNCRLIPSDFKLDITVKKTKEGKVLETKIYPNSTDYMYVVKLDKVK
jgi:very-short-patch-repair endonuclease